MFKISTVILLIISIFLIHSCEKDKPTLPSIVTVPVTEISNITATSGGEIISDGRGDIVLQGICWGTDTIPTIRKNIALDSTEVDSFTCKMAGLNPNTTYYVRAFATNNAGTGYGSVMSFTTQNYGTVGDIDGNIYNIVPIGTQIWMAENLKTTKYKNGASIPLVTDKAAWSSLTTPGYCWYNNEEAAYKNTYGALYNWYTANTGILCPAGWHVPTDAEFTTLTTYLGGEGSAGAKMKEAGITHWANPNTGATNESGFLGLPGGCLYKGGSWDNIGLYGGWWSSTWYYPHAYSRTLVYNRTTISRYNADEETGFSVRCLKD
jgi:uncharacterized protein (TIGR02145 family)